jgi:hypothetical protein
MENTPSLKTFLPEQPQRRYQPVGFCIYCESREGLTDEHIVPLGLGGRLLLPKASCRSCNEWTSKAERTCLRTMYGPLRLLYGLPSRRSANRPESLPLKVKRTADSDWEHIDVPQEKYPFLVLFPELGEPGALTGAHVNQAAGPAACKFWIRGASPSYEFKSLLEKLAKELGVHSVMPEARSDMAAFCRMLSKIALAYAVAELGYQVAAKSQIARFATNGDLAHCRFFIGDVGGQQPSSNSLHELSTRFVPPHPGVVVRVRLLAKLGTPTYLVAL